MGQQKTRIESEAVQRASESRTKHKPLVVSGISAGRLITITPSMYGSVDIDASYQRGETTMIGAIVRAVQAGGQILDPITVCRRPWETDSERMWIVDGHQRYCALSSLGKPVAAIVHESESHAAERTFFLSLNTRKQLGADVVALGWVGPSGALLRQVNGNSLHPLFERINFSQQSSRLRIGAVSLMGGAYFAATGQVASGGGTRVLAFVDHALQDRMNRARIEHYLNLIGHLFPESSAPLEVLRAMGIVAHERWKTEVMLPGRGVIERLRVVNWHSEVPVIVAKFRPVFVDIISKIWK